MFWNQNKILICVFVLLTNFTVYSFFDQSEEEKKELTARVSSELIKQAQSQSVIKLRQPAAIGKVTKNKDNKVKIFCDANPLKLSSDKSLLMLEISSCRELYGSKKNQLWVKNISNGFKAQIFRTSSDSFRTDFLQLNPGLNNIEIQGILKDGQKIVQTLEIQSGS
ncbi:MAG: hypothetical protein H7256_09735 [Bdellovibrio sp.]|nr:hypothetical protein [Bdellovibrio sp.]